MKTQLTAEEKLTAIKNYLAIEVGRKRGAIERLKREKGNKEVIGLHEEAEFQLNFMLKHFFDIDLDK